jgi:hypothetical protein
MSEPVAWRITNGEGGYEYRDDEPSGESIDWSDRYGRQYEKLYTHPADQSELVKAAEAMLARLDVEIQAVRDEGMNPTPEEVVLVENLRAALNRVKS